MNCEKHPKYKAILKPRVDCRACWILYLETVMELHSFVMKKIGSLAEEAPYGNKKYEGKHPEERKAPWYTEVLKVEKDG